MVSQTPSTDDLLGEGLVHMWTKGFFAGHEFSVEMAREILPCLLRGEIGEDDFWDYVVNWRSREREHVDAPSSV